MVWQSIDSSGEIPANATTELCRPMASITMTAMSGGFIFKSLTAEARRRKLSALVSVENVIPVSQLTGSNLRPQPQQRVVVPREPHQRVLIRLQFRQPLNRAIQLEQLLAPQIIANQALDPENAGHPHPTSHGSHAMPRRRGIDDQIAGGELGGLAAEVAVDDEFASS